MTREIEPIPEALIDAVFKEPNYVLSDERRAVQYPVLETLWRALPDDQRHLMYQYYNLKCTFTKLAKDEGITLRQCRMAIHRGTFRLRTRANPRYKEEDAKFNAKFDPELRRIFGC